MGITASSKRWITDDHHRQGKYVGPSKHSSFTRVTSSSAKREAWYSTPEAWLRGKIQDDDIDKTLWRVHDSLYDLTAFVDRHPGGSDWLSMTQGMDITEQFESSHAVDVYKVEATLKKFYIKEAPHPRNSPYIFEPNGFYKTLKKRTEPILKEKGTGPTIAVRLLQDLMAASFVVLSVLGVVLDSYWPIVAAGLSLGISTDSAHNFFHIRDNWRKYYFDLSLSSHYEWRIEHVLSHHGFLNTAWDVQVIWTAPVLEFLVNRKKNLTQRYGSWLYVHVVMALFFPIGFLCRVVSIAKGKQSIRPEFFLPVAQLILFSAYSRSGLATGILFWALLHMICSYWVALTGGLTGHHHPICFHDGDEPRAQPDYGLCILDATAVKVEDNDRNLFQSMVTFGDHYVHHLFPAVCLSKLKYVKPILEETMKEFGEELIFITEWQLFKGGIEQLARVEPHSFRYYLEQRRKTQTQAVWSKKV